MTNNAINLIFRHVENAGENVTNDKELQTIQALKDYRRKLKRFSPGVEVRFRSNPPINCASPVGIVDSNAALTAVRVVYLATSGKPTLAIAAESDLEPLEDLNNAQKHTGTNQNTNDA